MAKVLDSAAAIPADAAKSWGAEGVIRYLSDFVGKTITLHELANYKEAGLSVGLVWENGTTDYLGGAAAGAANGRAAKMQADALAWPNDRPIYVAIDTELQPSDFGLAHDYVVSFVGASGRPGGPHAQNSFVREWMGGTGMAWGWVAAAWNDGQPNHAPLTQTLEQVNVGGTNCDVNDAVGDWGGWGPAVATPSPDPDPTPGPTPEKPGPPTELGDIPVKRYVVTVATDQHGNGNKIVGLPFAKLVSLFIQGSGQPGVPGSGYTQAGPDDKGNTRINVIG